MTPTTRNILIGVGALVVIGGSFAGYKYYSDWRFQDSDEKVAGGKIVSTYTKQYGWTPITSMGLDQAHIDTMNVKYAKSPDGIYRKGIKIA